MPTRFPKILAVGDWHESEVTLSWAPSTWRSTREADELIDQAWTRAKAQLGDALFDGPMCRLESWELANGNLALKLSRTSYRIFLGTNIEHVERLAAMGREYLANPVGVSAALISSDGFLIMGMRNARVAYYPNRVHPFAGALEPRDDLSLFAAVRRELEEEVGLRESDTDDIRCTGIVEEPYLLQDELIFRVTSRRTRAEIESNLDRDEHHDSIAIRATRADIEAALQDERLTPVGLAAIVLWARTLLGDEWYFSRA